MSCYSCGSSGGPWRSRATDGVCPLSKRPKTLRQWRRKSTTTLGKTTFFPFTLFHLSFHVWIRHDGETLPVPQKDEDTLKKRRAYFYTNTPVSVSLLQGFLHAAPGAAWMLLLYTCSRSAQPLSGMARRTPLCQTHLEFCLSYSHPHSHPARSLPIAAETCAFSPFFLPFMPPPKAETEEKEER